MSCPSSRSVSTVELFAELLTAHQNVLTLLLPSVLHLRLRALSTGHQSPILPATPSPASSRCCRLWRIGMVRGAQLAVRIASHSERRPTGICLLVQNSQRETMDEKKHDNGEKAIKASPFECSVSSSAARQSFPVEDMPKDRRTLRKEAVSSDEF